MKINNKIKQILLILIVILILVITNKGEVKASLQSNPNTYYKKCTSIEVWIKEIRQMETEGETMGLSETLNEDLLASSESNNIDVHMIRATEYGATAILSTSGYGNPKNDNLIVTTTGNDTGVMVSSKHIGEVVAGGLSKELSEGRSILSPEIIDIRYYDLYNYTISSARIGDALGQNISTDSIINLGCTNWHTASNKGWVLSRMPYFVRGYGGIFAYQSILKTYNYSRGVAVCGEGI